MSGAPLYCYLRYCGFAYQAYDVVVNFGMWSADVGLMTAQSRYQN